MSDVYTPEELGQVEGAVPDEPGSAPHQPSADEDNETVEVFVDAGNTAAIAKALNDAAVGEEALVRWTGNSFEVPKRIADKADLSVASDAVTLPDTQEKPVRTVIEPGARKVAHVPEQGPAGTPNAAGRLNTAATAAGADSNPNVANGAPVPASKSVDKMSLAELRAHANDKGIDLGSATLKPDVVARIKDALDSSPWAEPGDATFGAHTAPVTETDPAAIQQVPADDVPEPPTSPLEQPEA